MQIGTIKLFPEPLILFLSAVAMRGQRLQLACRAGSLKLGSAYMCTGCIRNRRHPITDRVANTIMRYGWLRNWDYFCAASVSWVEFITMMLARDLLRIHRHMQDNGTHKQRQRRFVFGVGTSAVWG